MSDHPDVTVVVCSYNRADSLSEALESLVSLQTDGFSYEVLVVDNASTDHTPDVVQQAAASSACSVRYVMEKQPGVSFARNCGVREACGQWLVFFDDDELAEPDLLVQLLKAAEKKQVKCVGGAIKLCLIGENGEDKTEQRNLRPWVRVMFNCTRDMTVGQFYNRTCTPGTGNMLVHRDIFDKIGLFRTDLVEGGEDTDLYHRMRGAGFAVYYSPEALVHHRVPEFRLEPKYMKLASLRMGGHVARREYQHYNKLTYPMVIVARGLQTSLLHGSCLVFALIGGNKEAVLERKCKWWLGQGYLQAAMRFLFYKDAAVSSLQFRNERKPASSS